MFESSLDWKIAQKLIEGGGLGPRVYIWTPRANGRTVTFEQYMKHIYDRRQVVMMPAKKPEGVQLHGATLRSVVIDRDILSPESYARAERIWSEYWKDHNPMKVKGE